LIDWRAKSGEPTPKWTYCLPPPGRKPRCRVRTSHQESSITQPTFCTTIRTHSRSVVSPPNRISCVPENTFLPRSNSVTKNTHNRGINRFRILQPLPSVFPEVTVLEAAGAEAGGRLRNFSHFPHLGVGLKTWYSGGSTVSLAQFRGFSHGQISPRGACILSALVDFRLDSPIPPHVVWEPDAGRPGASES